MRYDDRILDSSVNNSEAHCCLVQETYSLVLHKSALNCRRFSGTHTTIVNVISIGFSRTYVLLTHEFIVMEKKYSDNQPNAVLPYLLTYVKGRNTDFQQSIEITYSILVLQGY